MVSAAAAARIQENTVHGCLIITQRHGERWQQISDNKYSSVTGSFLRFMTPFYAIGVPARKQFVASLSLELPLASKLSVPFHVIVVSKRLVFMRGK